MLFKIWRVLGPAAEILEKFLYLYTCSFVLIFGELGKWCRMIGLKYLLALGRGEKRYIGGILGAFDMLGLELWTELEVFGERVCVTKVSWEEMILKFIILKVSDIYSVRGEFLVIWVIFYSSLSGKKFYQSDKKWRKKLGFWKIEYSNGGPGFSQRCLGFYVYTNKATADLENIERPCIERIHFEALESPRLGYIAYQSQFRKNHQRNSLLSEIKIEFFKIFQCWNSFNKFFDIIDW